MSKGKCFIITPISQPGSSTRRRTENVYEFIINEVMNGEYEAVLPHEVSSTGIITMDIIELIVTSPLVIADLTDNNPNVYYELSLRHAIDFPAILIIEESQLESIPFDLKSMRVISYDLTDPSKIRETKTNLRNHIDTLEMSSSHGATPISSKVKLIKEPHGPHDNQVLLGTLLLANRVRYELINPYFETLEVSLEERNHRLQSAFQSIIREAAQKTYLRMETVLTVFKNPNLRDEIEELFSEVTSIIPRLTDAMSKQNERSIKTQLNKWRINNTKYLQIWARQYEEYISEN